MSYKASSVRPHLPIHDRNLSPILSFIRDGALFAYLICNFTTISLVFSTTGFSATEPLSLEGSLFWQLVVPSFLGIGILLQISGKATFRQVAVVATPILPVLIWILLSVTWSHFPDVSIRRAGRLLMETAAFFFFAAAYEDQYKFLRVIYFTFGFITVADVATLGVPDISFMPDGFAGVHYNKNDAGIFYLLALPIFLLAIIDRHISPSRIASASLALCCLVFLGLSLSKTSQPLAPVCLALTFCFISVGRVGSNHTLAVIFTILCVGAIIAAFIASVGLDNFLSYFVEDMTFSGRTSIWDYTLSLFWQAPIVGQGYGGIWNVGVYSLSQQDFFKITFILRHAHNGYIGMLAELGIVGLVLTISFLIITFYRLWRRIPLAKVRRINFIAIYVLFATCLINITEVSFFALGSNLWTQLLLVSSATFFIAPLSRQAFVLPVDSQGGGRVRKSGALGSVRVAP